MHIAAVVGDASYSSRSYTYVVESLYFSTLQWKHDHGLCLMAQTHHFLLPVPFDVRMTAALSYTNMSHNHCRSQLDPSVAISTRDDHVHDRVPYGSSHDKSHLPAGCRGLLGTH
jgi:hypothetical protein